MEKCLSESVAEGNANISDPLEEIPDVIWVYNLKPIVNGDNN